MSKKKPPASLDEYHAQAVANARRDPEGTRRAELIHEIRTTSLEDLPREALEAIAWIIFDHEMR